ncbi:eCIS core domain-containing protein [Streptomyces sp. 8N706]|uniref:eCIS core domain-containing protein n=1 Tax=Streptomyces sp. 8N706 TaxID=3457416 RepID=UPI003FCFB669
MDAPVKEEMEARLGADFSDVRLHTDAAARRSAAELGARAYTSGNHVVIGADGGDKRTLAHELTHVIQQRTGPVTGTDNGSGLKVSDPEDRFERAAEANAIRAMSGPVPHENRQGLAGEGGREPAQRTELPIQRARLASGGIAFTNVAVKYPEYVDKATRILELLSSHGAIKKFLGDRRCAIVLEKRTTESPAEVKSGGGDSVTVLLASYYFENYDIGYIAGMLCHEFGIHPVADAREDVRTEEPNFQGLPFPVPGLEETKQMNTDGAAQADHVLGVIPRSPRYEVYKNVTLEMATLLWQEVRDNVPGAKVQDVTDLLDCFLMDVASIAATNDNRLLARPGKSGSQEVRRDIAKVYERYKELLSTDESLDARIEPFFPPEKTPEAVKQDFLTLATRIAKGAIRAWSISKDS